jgi:DNA-binding CsgD family transcriptional regulator
MNVSAAPCLGRRLCDTRRVFPQVAPRGQGRLRAADRRRRRRFHVVAGEAEAERCITGRRLAGAAIVQIEYRTAVESLPRPCLLQFFGALASESPSVVNYERKRRDSDLPMRHDNGMVVIAAAPERRQVGKSKREANRTARPRKLTPEQVAELLRLAPEYSLRELAARFNVSRETARKIVRE